MREQESSEQPRRMRLYLWAAAFVIILGAVLMGAGYTVSGLLIAVIGLIAAVFVYRRRSRGGYQA